MFVLTITAFVMFMLWVVFDEYKDSLFRSREKLQVASKPALKPLVHGKTKIIGYRLILASGALAALSLLGGWAEVRFLFFTKFSTYTGLALGMFAILLIWVMPVFSVLKNKRMGITATIITLISSILIPISISIAIAGESRGPFYVDPGEGVLLFQIAGILLFVGVILNQLIDPMIVRFRRS